MEPKDGKHAASGTAIAVAEVPGVASRVEGSTWQCCQCWQQSGAWGVVGCALAVGAHAGASLEPGIDVGGVYGANVPAEVWRLQAVLGVAV